LLDFKLAALENSKGVNLRPCLNYTNSWLSLNSIKIMPFVEVIGDIFPKIELVI
jgi:hypothetical protein